MKFKAEFEFESATEPSLVGLIKQQAEAGGDEVCIKDPLRRTKVVKKHHHVSIPLNKQSYKV